MALFPNEHETIEGVGRALRAGRCSCVDVLERCLDRIEEWEPRVKAWVVVDREGALAQARALDEELARGRCRGPLHGIPIGVKDIIDVEGFPTAAGFRPWAGRVARRDAPIVAGLRNAGAVLLGKTVTTQFAWVDPPVTRNPWDLGRTPGGSSSGSAAAVAIGMCLGALGTQTGGSIVRPASYCGVSGFKPAFRAPSEGILPFSPHLDHPGPIARSVLDLGLMFGEFELSAADHASLPEAVEETLATTFAAREEPPRLGRLRGHYEHRADPDMRRAFERALADLTEAGAEVSDVPDPFDFEQVIRDHRTIMAAEAAGGHEARFAEHAGEYGPRIRALVEEGATITAVEYLRARGHQDELRASLPGRLPGLDALVMPATAGPAPDPSTTGDPAFNAPWSYTGSPTVSLPIGLSPEGLPLAIQLVDPRPIRERDLIATARWCEEVLRAAFRARRP